MNVKQLATAAAVAMIMSSGSLLAADTTTLGQYLRTINHDTVVENAAKDQLAKLQGIYMSTSSALSAETAKLGTLSSAYSAAVATQTADLAKLASDLAGVASYASNSQAQLKADADAVTALKAAVKADQKANDKAKYKADNILLAAAKAKHQHDIDLVKSGSPAAAIAADRQKLQADYTAVGLALQAKNIEQKAYDAANAANILAKAHVDTVSSNLSDDVAAYNKDFAACAASYSASAC